MGIIINLKMQPNANRQNNINASNGSNAGAHPLGQLNFQKVDNEQLRNIVNNWIIAPDNTDTQVWKAVTDVPVVHKYLAIAAAVFNLILPGFGTAIAACGAASGNVSKVQLPVGLFQFLTSPFLIGWILSIYWGYLIVVKAWAAQNSAQ